MILWKFYQVQMQEFNGNGKNKDHRVLSSNTRPFFTQKQENN
jgi:hypothetical protein